MSEALQLLQRARAKLPHIEHSDDGDDAYCLVVDAITILKKQEPLEAAAKKAATTGNQKDLHDYLKLRRELL